MKRITIKDVALRANVSISTVSRVIHNEKNVASDYVVRVRQAIEELGWHPNSVAQSLRHRNGSTVGLVLPNTIDPFFGSIADSIISTAAKQNLNIITMVSHTGSGYDEIACFKRLTASSVDGIIFCSIAQVDREILDDYFANIPLVLCSRREMIPGRPHVFFDHQKGGYLATRHLLEMGHRKIALFVGVFGDSFHTAADLEPFLKDPVLAGPYSGIDKYIGARRAMDEYGAEFYPELVEFVDLGNAYQSGFEATQRLISKTTEFDAIFTTNDLSATGAIHMLAKQKLEVPDDVSIIGYDDGIMATSSQPQLSTIVQDTRRLGLECTNVIAQLIDGKPCSDVMIDVSLIVRQSSCRHQV